MSSLALFVILNLRHQIVVLRFSVVGISRWDRAFFPSDSTDQTMPQSYDEVV